MYAVIEACGKQYKVTKGDVVLFEKLDAEEGKKVTFDKVILLSDESSFSIPAEINILLYNSLTSSP